MRSNAVRVIVLLLLLLTLMCLVPSAALLPDALAEDAAAFVALPIDNSFGKKPNLDGYLPNNGGYEDESISVSISMDRAYDTNIMIAWVRIADPSQIRTTMAGNYGSTSLAPAATIAKRVNAVFAVNGDYYNFDGRGYLVRQGHRYRKNIRANTDLLAIDDQGNLHIFASGQPDEASGLNIINTFNFGPALVIDGELGTRLDFGGIGGHKPTQRMVICQSEPLNYLFIATEGPENKGSRGLTIPEMANYAMSLGVRVAYNLDGGSSSTMVLHNQKINSLSSGKIRSVADIIYFATLEKR
ncbi:exopolysaccharide biosynthesis protein [Clostridia bacterium]|nr:exopolysaccharide biosynthesis protein [Clostridia bacterium]